MALLRLEAMIQTGDGSSMCLTHLKNVQSDCDMCQVRRCQVVAAAKDSLGINKGIVHETKVVYHYLDYTNIGSDIPMTQEGQYNMVLQVGFEGLRMGINKECPLSRWRINLRENLS